MSTRTYAARGVVIRTRALGEKDRVVVLLTQELGKISAAARGSRNPKSKLAAAAQPFTLAKFLLAKGRNLDVVSQAEVENAHTHVAGDLLKTAWASYFCELCDVIPEDLPEAELFELLELTLNRLDQSNSSDESELIGRWFETKYLSLLGYAPTIGNCVACGTKISIPQDDKQRAVCFSPVMGGTLCESCVSRDASRLFPKVQALRALHLLSRANTPPDAAAFLSQLELTISARRDLRDALQRSVFSHLDIRLKSRAFLDEILATQHS